jgi:hypothetical protein
MKKNTQTATAPLSGGNVISLCFLLLYVFVDFVPSFDAFDIIGFQWLYVGIVNLAVLAYFFVTKKYAHETTIANIVLQPSVISYVIYFLIAAISVLFAINSVEFIVCFARLIITIIAFVNFILLLKDNHRSLRIICQVIAVVAVIKCLQSLNIFFRDVPELGLIPSYTQYEK